MILWLPSAFALVYHTLGSSVPAFSVASTGAHLLRPGRCCGTADRDGRLCFDSASLGDGSFSSSGGQGSTRRRCQQRKPLVAVIQDDVVIGADELVPGWIQRHDFDLGIVRFQPSDHFFSGLFRCQMANNK